MLTPHQQQVVDGILASKDQYISLCGLAGTGKTTVLKHLYDLWSSSGLRVYVLAPTGKASMILRSKGVPATTIHRAIYHFKGKYVDHSGDTQLIFKDNGKDRFCDRILVDESSMPNARQIDEIKAKGVRTLFC